MKTLADLMYSQRVIVSCGGGGVGKTTTAAALALRAAKEGRRTLALTIDPSKRLAQALGVSMESAAPVVPLGLRALAGKDVPLDVWLLDPRAVAERVIRQIVPDAKAQRALFDNRVYRELATMTAGMVEYTALEALDDFVASNRYDLIVLDTPPSRHALEVLDGPRRLAAFLDSKIFQLFLPPHGTSSSLRAGASRVLRSVLGAALGEAEHLELQQFFGAFAGVLRACGTHTARLEALLSDRAKVSFVLVTAPAPSAIDEARFFERQLAAKYMHCGGLVVMRCDTKPGPRAATAEELFALGPELASALSAAAIGEKTRRDDHTALLLELRKQLDPAAFLTAVPSMGGGIDTLEDLDRVGSFLVDSAHAAP